MAEDNNIWKWVLAPGGGLASWQLWKRSRANNPDVLEANALKVLQKDFNPFSSDDLAEQMKAGAILEGARIRREHAEMEKAGYPIDRNTEKAPLEMMRQNHTLGDGWTSCDKLLGGSGRLYQDACEARPRRFTVGRDRPVYMQWLPGRRQEPSRAICQSDRGAPLRCAHSA